jgi:hypothetical protein
LTPANLHFCLIVKAIDPSSLHAGCLWQDQWLSIDRRI